VGGVIIRRGGHGQLFFLNSASFLAVLLALQAHQAAPAGPRPETLLRAWKELLDYLLHRRELKLILLLIDHGPRSWPCRISCCSPSWPGTP